MNASTAPLARYDQERKRATEARRESAYLRELYKIATCGLSMRIAGVHYGNAGVLPHVARRVADMYLVWAAEYDFIAEEIERRLEAQIVGKP